MPRADELVFEAVDECLSIFGDDVKKSIYYFMERNYGLRSREDILSNLEKFHQGLHSIFGIGAGTIEKQIIRRLQEKAKVHITLDSDTTFAEAVKKIRQAIENSKS
jgi:CRISPR/Cas system CSM-associated protein Csm5 (group 7 of RAMP superfamily)